MTGTSHAPRISPVAVLSKGRAGRAPTVTNLLAASIRPTIYIEPQEESAYAQAYPDCPLRVLPESNRGVAYVRQVILEDARQRGGRVWVLDDDLTRFHEAWGGKVHDIPADSCLLRAEAILTQRGDIALGSLEFRQYAWSATTDLTLDSYCNVAVLIDIDKTRLVNYRPLAMKEDRDFAMQVLASGWHTARTARLAFDTPKVGTNPGGCHDDYEQGKELKTSRQMARLWPGFCDVIRKRDGRIDVKINWKRLAKMTHTPASPPAAPS